MAQFGTDAGSAVRHGAITVGLRNVGSYQVSGHPFVTGAILYATEEKQISFPYVTKSITVINSGSASGIVSSKLKIHFASTGSSTNVVGQKHYIELNTFEDSFEFDVKCKEIYISSAEIGGFMLYASLTNIPTGSMYSVTGSGITE